MRPLHRLLHRPLVRPGGGRGLGRPYINLGTPSIAGPGWLLRAGNEIPVIDLSYASGEYFYNGPSYSDHSALLTAIGGTHTRADATTCATYFDSAGVLQTAAANVLRFDYNPATLAAKGVLLEGSRINLWLRSEELNVDGAGSPWTHNDVTVSADSISAPDGQSTAEKITEAATTAEHRVVQSITLADATTYTVSFFAKQGTLKRCMFRESTASGSWCLFDVNSGSVVGTAGGLASSITNAGNGWYRCTFTWANSGAAARNHNINLMPDSATTVTDRSYAGDTANYLYIWGVQQEAGAFPSSYIPTTTAAVTRAADSYTIGPTGGVPFTGWNASEGSLVIGFTPLGLDNGRLLEIDDGSAAERIYFQYTTGGVFDVTITDNSVAQTTFPTVAASVNNPHKWGLGWKANDVAKSLDGGAVVTDSSVSLPTLTTLFLAKDFSGADNAAGHFTISRFTYFASRISNADLVRLST